MVKEKMTGKEQERLFNILESVDPIVNKVKLNKQITTLVLHAKYLVRSELRTKINKILNEEN